MKVNQVGNLEKYAIKQIMTRFLWRYCSWYIPHRISLWFHSKWRILQHRSWTKGDIFREFSFWDWWLPLFHYRKVARDLLRPVFRQVVPLVATAQSQCAIRSMRIQPCRWIGTQPKDGVWGLPWRGCFQPFVPAEHAVEAPMRFPWLLQRLEFFNTRAFRFLDAWN